MRNEELSLPGRGGREDDHWQSISTRSLRPRPVDMDAADLAPAEGRDASRSQHDAVTCTTLTGSPRRLPPFPGPRQGGPR